MTDPRSRLPVCDLDYLTGVLACPDCRVPLIVPGDVDLRCGDCGACFVRLPFGWDLRPASTRPASDLWPVWEQMQANGVVSYASDPEHNLGVGPRPDYLAFGQFCRFDGDVLDVGCGPQAWPTHFTDYTSRTRFVGVDPLVGDAPADYAQLRALGERLPFRNDTFDHLVFATSMDHCVDPVLMLREAARVCRPAGEIDIWIGEKSSDAPGPTQSPEWYQGLVKPPTAEDVFHIKRIGIDELRSFGRAAGLEISEDKVQVVDQYRKNYFCRLRKAKR